MIEQRATWKEMEERWHIPRLELAGNNTIEPIHSSIRGMPRPETEYARQKRATDSNPRWRYDNVLDLDLDIDQASSDDYVETTGSVRSDIERILNLDIDDEGRQIHIPTNMPNPYLRYSKSRNGKSTNSRGKSRKGKRSPRM